MELHNVSNNVKVNAVRKKLKTSEAIAFVTKTFVRRCVLSQKF